MPNVPAPGSDNYLQLPDTLDISQLETVMNENAVASSEFGGGTITLDPGDIILGHGVATDGDGNVWTLEPMTGIFADTPMAQVTENGGPVNENGSGGWADALRIVNGEATWENAKGVGWFTTNDYLGQDAPPPGAVSDCAVGISSSVCFP